MHTQSAPTTARAGLLASKNAVILGSGGAVGTAIAREFAAQGAALYVSNRRLADIQTLVAAIQDLGADVRGAEVDALDEPTVNDYLDGVVRQAGRIDILLNVMGPQPQQYSNGTSTLELPLDHFLLPLNTLVRSQFVTARAAARHMVQQQSGVILFVTALPSRGVTNTVAIGAAFGAMESLARSLAVDLGPAGVRVAVIRSGAMVDTRTIQQSVDNAARRMSIPKEQLIARFEQSTLLKRLPTAHDTARLAAFLASDGARAITGAIVNASSGSIID